MTYEDIVRFGGDCQVRAFRREALLCHRWRCCCGRRDLRIHRHEQRGAGCHINDHLPNQSSYTGIIAFPDISFRR